jgi:peptide/nickel transport system permease protein
VARARSSFAICLACLLARRSTAKHVAHTTPNATTSPDVIKVGGKNVNVVSPEGNPDGPTWHGRFFLGADRTGATSPVRCSTAGATRSRSGSWRR